MKIRFLFSTLFLLIFVQFATAQNKISGSVLGNGATAASNGNFKIVGTLGQLAIGLAGSSNNLHQAGFWYTAFDLVTSVEQLEDDLLPTEFRLEQNYPNPFNPSTTIQFAVPKTSNVTIKIYDIIGRQVATLVDEEYQPGHYKVIFEAGQLATGLYVYRVQTEGFHEAKKFLLLK